MNVAICDDESIWREIMTELLNEYRRERHIDIFIECFSDGSSLINCPRKFDVIFMDHYMGGLSGIETARLLRRSGCCCTIMFFSAFPDAAPDAFEINAFRFFVKPIDKEKLFRSLDDHLKSEKITFLIFKTHNGTIKIRESDITYCESVQRHTIIHTVSEAYEILVNLGEVEKKLPKNKFARCHKAYIVSFFHIKRYYNTYIILENGEKAYIGRKYLHNFVEAFYDYSLKYNRPVR